VLEPSEVVRRLPKMMEVFGPGTDDSVPVIACINRDRSTLPPELETEIPKPSILHALVRCDICDEECWIGPVQAATAGTRTCYVCLAILAPVQRVPAHDGEPQPGDRQAPAAARLLALVGVAVGDDEQVDAADGVFEP